MTQTHDSDDGPTDTTHSTDVDLEIDAASERDPLFARIPRRDFMKAGMAAGAVGAMGSLAGCTSILDRDGSVSIDDVDTDVAPGELDEYYAFLSGGHSGEVRVYGVPSMRQLMRIPVFSKESARGYGYDDETREMLEESGGYTWGDVHHPRVSQTDNEYDGRWLFVNDKANGRLARIDLTYFETDAIVDLPNQQGTHGACALMPDTKYIFGVGEFRVPLPNDGRNLDDPEEYTSVLSAVDPETMNPVFDVLVDGNMDNADSGKDGRWFFGTCYNSEEAVTESEMTRSDTDYVQAFDIPAIEDAVENGDYEEIDGVPVVDGTKDSSLNGGDSPIVHYIDVPSNPHGVTVTPDGSYAIASGKLDNTCSVIDIARLDEVDDLTDAIVGQPELGMGPLHTRYDDRGHAYTSLFIDSQVVKWDIERAVDSEPGSDEAVVDRIDVHYSPGHLNTSQSYTADPRGDWLISLNKHSMDRFLPVGPTFPVNDQLIYIGDDEEGMQLVKDTPGHPEPHDATIVHRDNIEPETVYDPDDLELDQIGLDETGIEREDGRVHVKMYNQRNHFGHDTVTVEEGDEVTITTTNIESAENIVHSLAIPQYDINVKTAPQETREVTFTADKPGVYWMYCAYFCSALHLEMRSRLLVEPKED
ncbi:TAT-dependent nitrous-oxide reductase [Natronorubrum texcoconense]|uniref:Nitrous-oxide reductase n=1 Tax=Natronorubrum texcoconense TaxID=1095776 RepID=A0A1G9BWV6_9EURY|nr:TAT-dependent nitrous-oxide reductase [Natronorubrum texcoconense]SDK43870.1 nitrous oxide reductase apoprotein [Natronorubrum texcoconense]